VLLGHADYYRYNYFDGTYELRDGEKPVKAEGYLTDLINQRAVAFVRKHAGQPFFLYVPYNAVHSPYQPPERPLPAVTKENMYDGTRRDYAAMLEKIDEASACCWLSWTSKAFSTTRCSSCRAIMAASGFLTIHRYSTTSRRCGKAASAFLA